MHKPDTQIDVPLDFKNARQDVPYEFDFHKKTDINPALGRVDVNDSDPAGGVPEPFCNMPGNTIDFDSVGDRAADEDHGAEAPDGGSDQGKGYGGFVAPHIHD